MTIEKNKNTDQSVENKPEKQADTLKAERIADTRDFDKRKAMDAQAFSVSDIDTDAIKKANEQNNNAFQLVQDGQVVATRVKPGGSGQVAADQVKTEGDGPVVTAPAKIAGDSSASDPETVQKLGAIAQVSPEAKRLTDDCLGQMNKIQQQLFLKSLDSFQNRKDLSQPDKDAVYGQLARLMEAEDCKLGGDDKARRDTLRITVAEQFMFHAAHPHKIDQGDFNTCNVTCVAEKLFTRNPGIAAEIAVTTALNGEWVNPKDHKVIKIDKESLWPAQNTTTWVPPKDEARSFDTQILNVVLVNDATQRETPPKKYLQKNLTVETDSHGKPLHLGNGERLYLWDAQHDKLLAPEKENKIIGKKHVAVDVCKPNIDLKQISDIGTRLTGESHYVIVPFPADIDHKTKKPIDDGLVHIASEKQLEDTLRDMKAHDRLPAIIFVDAHSPLFERFHNFPPGSPHVVTIRDYNEKDGVGRVTISNQWGEDNDIKANVGDLFGCCKVNMLPENDKNYQLTKSRVLNKGNIEKDFDT